ncbi:hypothetical protein QQ045_020245 [Rhodiola kirilowii]
MNGAYWGLTTLDLLGKLDAVDVDEVVSWIISCQHECGRFGDNVGHDPHILYTLSAVQVLPLFDKLDVLDNDLVSNCILSNGISKVIDAEKSIMMRTNAFENANKIHNDKEKRP